MSGKFIPNYSLHKASNGKQVKFNLVNMSTHKVCGHINHIESSLCTGLTDESGPILMR